MADNQWINDYFDPVKENHHPECPGLRQTVVRPVPKEGRSYEVRQWQVATMNFKNSEDVSIYAVSALGAERVMVEDIVIVVDDKKVFFARVAPTVCTSCTDSMLSFLCYNFTHEFAGPSQKWLWLLMPSMVYRSGDVKAAYIGSPEEVERREETLKEKLIGRNSYARRNRWRILSERWYPRYQDGLALSEDRISITPAKEKTVNYRPGMSDFTLTIRDEKGLRTFDDWQKPHSVLEEPHSVVEEPHSVDEEPHSVNEEPHSVDEEPHSVVEEVLNT